MFFVGYLDKVFVVVILDVILMTSPTERESVFRWKCGVEGISQQGNTSNGRYVEEYGRQHPTWQVEGVGRTLPEVHRGQ